MATPVDAFASIDRLRVTAAHRVGSIATTALWAVSRQRILFTVAICALVSTQAFFQPNLYEPFLPLLVLRTWLDYFGECLVMGIPIMVAATLAERVAAAHSRAAAIGLAAISVAAGALTGALALVPYYDSDWSEAFGVAVLGRRHVLDRAGRRCRRDLRLSSNAPRRRARRCIRRRSIVADCRGRCSKRDCR